MKQNGQYAIVVLQWVSLNYYFIYKKKRIKIIKFVRWWEEYYLSMILCSLLSINPPSDKISKRFSCSPTPSPSLTNKIEQKPDSFLGIKNHCFFHNLSKLLAENFRARYWFFASFRSIHFFSVKRRQNETSP